MALALGSLWFPAILKNIELWDLKLRMFVQKMNGSKFEQPLWKSNFLIEDHGRLQLLIQSKLRGVVIDTTKGKDEHAPPADARVSVGEPTTIASRRIKAINKRTKREAVTAQPVSVEQELDAAQAIAHEANEHLHRTFMAARLGKALNVKPAEPVVNDILASIRRNRRRSVV